MEAWNRGQIKEEKILTHFERGTNTMANSNEALISLLLSSLFSSFFCFSPMRLRGGDSRGEGI